MREKGRERKQVGKGARCKVDEMNARKRKTLITFCDRENLIN